MHGRDTIPRRAPIASPAIFDQIERCYPFAPQFVFLARGGIDRLAADLESDRRTTKAVAAFGLCSLLSDLVLDRFGTTDDESLSTFTTSHWSRWGSEFTLEAYVRGDE